MATTTQQEKKTKKNYKSKRRAGALYVLKMINGRPRELEIVDVIGKLYQFSKQAPEIAIHTQTHIKYIFVYQIKYLRMYALLNRNSC